MGHHGARFALTLAALTVAACSGTSATTGQGGATGGGQASGGSRFSASGGASTEPAGTGGGFGRGGEISATTGQGGGLASGGATRVGTGGRSGSTGGATAVAGQQGRGGRSDVGGAPGSGGRATGGSPGSGGVSASGGAGCSFDNEIMGWATQSGSTTGGGDAPPTTVTSLGELNDAARGTNAAVIQISGTISGTVSVGSNKTLLGACGGKATIKGRVQLSGSQNVILRNLSIVGNNCTDSPSDCSAGTDAVTVVNGANHLWFDHCEVSDGSDGNLDMTHAADFITISWTKFRYSGRRSGGHQFCNLIGHDDNNAAEDTNHLNVTFDHVWWADNVAQRMPRVRFGKVHVVNSLYSASGNDSGVGVGVNCNVRVENCVFVGINSALYFNNSNSASIAESIGNKFTGSSGTSGRGTSFKPPYPYQLESLATVEASVRAGAGPR